ncbi:MAG: antibiotic biosynthesis monooxygenase family protein [Actinomycetota bacterium]|nr:antibiotic biosynthesis monooxygenase family protein [Actinomycetota bacterium]
MLIVAGHITVAAAEREAYLAGCADVVAQARRTPGCLDFAVSADLVDAGRVNVFERWRSPGALAAFRQGGPGGEQRAAMLAAAVAEYDVAGSRTV